MSITVVVAFLKVDVFLWLSVRNSDNHSGGFHTYEKTHTQSHTYTHTHIRVCDGAVCSLLSPHLFLHQAALRGGLASALVSKHQLALSTPLTLPPPPFLFFLSLSLSSPPLLYIPALHLPARRHLFPPISPHILLAPFSPSSRCSNTVHFFFINLFALTISPPGLVSVFEGVKVSDRQRYGRTSVCLRASKLQTQRCITDFSSLSKRHKHTAGCVCLRAGVCLSVCVFVYV